ncbi:MAG: hypothetical protein GXY48_01925 [Methanomicrobiales archaeon]|nr:hypothetical protein [Methanomicrobiales archaeon]
MAIISLSSPVAGNTQEKTETTGFSISTITLKPNETIISPGITITPIVTVNNTQMYSNLNATLQFSARLGNVNLLSDKKEWPVPHVGEENTYFLRFTIPSILPGEYQLNLSAILIEADNRTVIPYTKAKTVVQVTHPKPGSGSRDCGCS